MIANLNLGDCNLLSCGVLILLVNSQGDNETLGNFNVDEKIPY